MKISSWLFLPALLLTPVSAQQAAVQQVPGADCTTVRLDDFGSLSVKAGKQTVTLQTPLTFRCGTLKVVDNGQILNVSGKNLAEVLSIFPADSAFGQVWGLYTVDFRKPGQLRILDSSDGTTPDPALLQSMKGTIGDVSATFTQPGGTSGWVFRNGQLQAAKYDIKQPLTVTIRSSQTTPPWTSIVLDARKGTLRAVRAAQ